MPKWCDTFPVGNANHFKVKTCFSHQRYWLNVASFSIILLLIIKKYKKFCFSSSHLQLLVFAFTLKAEKNPHLSTLLLTQQGHILKSNQKDIWVKYKLQNLITFIFFNNILQGLHCMDNSKEGFAWHSNSNEGVSQQKFLKLQTKTWYQ